MILWGTMMKPSAVVCPVCLANLSSSVWPSFSLLMRVGMQGSLIMALPLDWNFVKQRGAPGRPQYGRTGEDCHPPRLAAPGSCHTRNSVPVMHGRLFEVQRPCPLPRDSARISRSDCNSHCGRDGLAPTTDVLGDMNFDRDLPRGNLEGTSRRHQAPGYRGSQRPRWRRSVAERRLASLHPEPNSYTS